MSSTRDLKVRKGEKVRVAWERLLRWVDSLKIVPDDDIDVRITRHGTVVRVRDKKPFRHPFRVIVGDKSVLVGLGTVNGIVPTIKTKEEGKRRIDNCNQNGERETDLDAPILPIDYGNASKDGRIYIMLKVKRLVTGGLAGLSNESLSALQQSDEAVEIIQHDSPQGPKDEFAYYPIAFLWLSKNQDEVEQVFQIVHHNIRYEFQKRRVDPADEEERDDKIVPGRHIFFPT